MANIFDLADTWNDIATTFRAIKMNVTDTASAAGSLLLDIQKGSVSYFSITKNGIANLVGTGSNGNGYGWHIENSNGAALGQFNAKAGLHFGANGVVAWGAGAPAQDSQALDLMVNRSAAGVLGVRGASTSAGAALEFVEQTAPSAPSANSVRLYAEDNGSGKTRIVALFPSGAAQVLAVEP
jgi:hypothetical protein